MGLFKTIMSAMTGAPSGGSGSKGPDPSWVQEGLSMAQPGAVAQGSGYIPGHGSVGGGGVVGQINALNNPMQANASAVAPAPAQAAQAPNSNTLDAMAKSRGFRNYDEMMAFARQKYQPAQDANVAGPVVTHPDPWQHPIDAATDFVHQLINPFQRLSDTFNRANSGN